MLETDNKPKIEDSPGNVGWMCLGMEGMRETVERKRNERGVREESVEGNGCFYGPKLKMVSKRKYRRN